MSKSQPPYVPTTEDLATRPFDRSPSEQAVITRWSRIGYATGMLVLLAAIVGVAAAWPALGWWAALAAVAAGVVSSIAERLVAKIGERQAAQIRRVLQQAIDELSDEEFRRIRGIKTDAQTLAEYAA